MKKTNAARILDRLNLPYRLEEFPVDKTDLSAEDAAARMGVPPKRVFKTLVVRGSKSGVLVVSIPGGSELDLKALAGLSGNKKVVMVPLKEVRQLTGYTRGAVSPLGMKSSYPFYLDQSALKFPSIYISAGAHGVQINLAPQDLVKILEAITGKITLSSRPG